MFKSGTTLLTAEDKAAMKELTDRHERRLNSRHRHMSLMGKTLVNSNGDIDPNSLGFQETVTTLTYIRKRIVQQLFYEVRPSEFMPVLVGEGSFSQSILTNLQISAGGNFESGIINSGIANDRIAAVQAGITPITVPIVNWAMSLGYTIFELEQALQSLNWDYIAGLEKSRKMNYDLGIQAIAFLGSLSVPGVYGLLTQPDVNINTMVITEAISTMDPTEFMTFVSKIIAVYQQNNNTTVYPDVFAIPQSDWNGLATAVSPTYPNIMKIEWLQRAFDMICRKKVKIMPLAYGDAAHNSAYGLDLQRYALYRYDEDSLRMDVPVKYTPTAPNTANNFQFQNVAYSQWTGCRFYRPLEGLYFDYTP